MYWNSNLWVTAETSLAGWDEGIGYSGFPSLVGQDLEQRQQGIPVGKNLISIIFESKQAACLIDDFSGCEIFVNDQYFSSALSKNRFTIDNRNIHPLGREGVIVTYTYKTRLRYIST